MNTKTIPALLANIATDRSLSDRQLAQAMGVSTSALHRWTHAIGVPDPIFCWKIAELAGLTISEVMVAAGHLPPAETASAAAPDFIDPAVRRLLESMTWEEQRRVALPMLRVAAELLHGERP